ncbi:hypothetical protein ADUPG1_013470 [Aduncisulcus paluster]|uniref:Reverse transcriptase domain-containing protein n=1 Tax=Aduncisulcus paluster TaxID=2918883 RepID=A0ABQ5K4U6_9EUKA|nr:hypothetical protein ADUPG1_013470 [Aduncisulcus paluster]
MKESKVMVEGVGGSVESKGKVKTWIRVEGSQDGVVTEEEFHVFERLPYEVLVGREMISRYSMKMGVVVMCIITIKCTNVHSWTRRYGIVLIMSWLWVQLPHRRFIVKLTGNSCHRLVDKACHRNGIKEVNCEPHQIIFIAITTGVSVCRVEKAVSEETHYVPEEGNSLSEVRIERLQERVLTLLKEVREVFDPLDEIPAQLKPFTIEVVEGASIPYEKPRWFSPKLKDEISKQIKELLGKGIIRKSASPFSCPVVMVPKGGDVWRMCADYRRLNAITVPDRHPLPRIHDLLSYLHGKKYFGTLDLRSGYYQAPVDEKSRQYTAFVTWDGEFEYTRLPFGLRNAPSYFQRSVQEVLKDCLYKKCLVFVDDILIFGATEEEFLENLREFLQKLQEVHFKLKGSKCVLAAEEVVFLGQIISAQGRTLSPEKVKDLKENKRPGTQKS